jgi:hypothetical protein
VWTGAPQKEVRSDKWMVAPVVYRGDQVMARYYTRFCPSAKYRFSQRMQDVSRGETDLRLHYPRKVVGVARVYLATASRSNVMPKPGVSGIASIPSSSNCQPPTVNSST